MVTPLDYARRYHEIEVELDSGTVTVDIRKYKMGPPTGQKDKLWQHIKQYFREHTEPLALRVDGATELIHRGDHIATWITRPFTGKGNPERVQIVAQLAVRFLPKVTLPTLQGWCDTNLGLDCNGFVGNYLYYGKGGHDWRVDAPAGQGGPDDVMTVFERMGEPVTDTAEMVPDHTYIGLETRHGMVISGGGQVGHIVITQRSPGVVPQPQEFMVVESTGDLGLTSSWYWFPPSTDAHGVHRVYRSCKWYNPQEAWLHFKVVDLNAVTGYR